MLKQWEKSKENPLKDELNLGSVNLIPITPSNRSAIADYIALLDEDFSFIKENFIPETFTKAELLKSKYTPSKEIEKIKTYTKAQARLGKVLMKDIAEGKAVIID